MKVLMTGATGFVGRHLALRLKEEGNQIVVLSRSVEGAKKKLLCQAEVFRWDSLKEEVPRKSLENVDAVINLAGESLVEKRWTSDQKTRIRDSRVLGTRALVRAIRSLNSPPTVFLSASAVGFYGDRGEDRLDESSPPGSGFLSEVCTQWENELAGLPSQVRTVVTRIGMVLGDKEGALKRLVPLFQLGLGGPTGSGKQWVSWIHVEDLVGLQLHLLKTRQAHGVYNGVAPTPVTNKDFARCLGKSLGRPAVVPTPTFAVKLALGEMACVVLDSARVHSVRVPAVAFQPQYPDLEKAFAKLFGLNSTDS